MSFGKTEASAVIRKQIKWFCIFGEDMIEYNEVIRIED